MAAGRAKTDVGVSPYTLPSATATPLGPGPLRSGALHRYSHSSFPEASASAYTLESRSCRYTTPPCTIGAAANEPDPPTPAAALPVSLNVQAGLSLDTSADEIVECGATRVFARSAFA